MKESTIQRKEMWTRDYYVSICINFIWNCIRVYVQTIYETIYTYMHKL